MAGYKVYFLSVFCYKYIGDCGADRGAIVHDMCPIYVFSHFGGSAPQGIPKILNLPTPVWRV